MCVKTGYTGLISDDPAAKVNGAFYRTLLLLQQLLPAACQMSS